MKLYLTEIEDTKEADVYFPEFDKEDFKVTAKLDNDESQVDESSKETYERFIKYWESEFEDD